MHWISGGFLFSFSFGSSKKNVILSYIVHTISKLFTIGSRAWLINIGNRLKWFYRTGKFDYFKGNKNDLVEILAVQPYLTPLQSCWSKQVYLRVRVWCIWEGFGFSFKGCPLKCISAVEVWALWKAGLTLPFNQTCKPKVHWRQTICLGVLLLTLPVLTHIGMLTSYALHFLSPPKCLSTGLRGHILSVWETAASNELFLKISLTCLPSFTRTDEKITFISVSPEQKGLWVLYCLA